MGHAAFRNAKPFVVRWCFCLVAMEVIGAALAYSGLYALCDFRTFYSAGYLTRTQPAELYNLAVQKSVQDAFISTRGFLPFFHLPYEALLYAPFSMLHARSAYLALIALNMLLLLAAFSAARSQFSLWIPVWQPEPGAMFFIFIPLLIAVIYCQDSLLLLLLYCLAWKQLSAEKDRSAGFFVALALFKFQFAIPIAFLISVRRGWRFITGFATTAAAVALICFGMLGRTGVISYIHALLGAASAMDNTRLAQELSNQPLSNPNISGLLYACGARFISSPFLFNLVIGMICLAVFVCCLWVARRRELDVAFSIAILCGLLVGDNLHIYDLTLCLLPVALLTGRIHRQILLAFFALPLVAIALGTRWHFLLALPLLAMLLQIVAFAPQPEGPNQAILNTAGTS